MVGINPTALESLLQISKDVPSCLDHFSLRKMSIGILCLKLIKVQDLSRAGLLRQNREWSWHRHSFTNFIFCDHLRALGPGAATRAAGLGALPLSLE